MESKLNFKQIIPWSIAALFVVLFLITAIRSCNSDLQIAQQSKLASEKQIDLSDVKIWKDKYDQLHYKFEREQVDKAVIQAQADSLANLLNIKSKQVQAFSYVKSGVDFKNKLQVQTIRDTIRDTITNTIKVSSPYSKFVYSDKWMDIRGDIGKTDSIFIKGQDTLVRVDYWKRKWFLGSKHYYSDFSNKNPYIQLQGFKQLETIPNKTHWSIGPYVGYGFDDKLNSSSTFGISLQYSLIKF